MTLRAASLLFAATLAAAQCPQVHIFGARETTVPPGFGTAGPVVSSIMGAFPGSTSEAIVYPACGGQASCGGVSYASSATQGVAAVASQVNSFNSQCPNTVLVLVGYSQGGQIMDDAYCGGGDTNEGITNTAIPISTAAQKKIAAAIFMGDPRHIPGLSYNVGTCQASGFAPRPAGFQCPFASNIQSYCDAMDPFCCNGTNQATHQGYATEYGSVALAFVKNKVNAALSGSGSTSTATTPPSNPTGGSVAEFGQCGGQGWTGGTVCVAPFTCQELNAFFFQCL
ncbi:Acetyl xylan esterase [Mycena venus]|uniref:cutinase n=1 Tax=Mycena venus TaxID=2733690 RepID=A0A8H7CKS7_9AGAR|nr:Acetyl xylan esterase [Mycena venus]